MARVAQLRVLAENKPGALAMICSEFAQKAINITAIMATPETNAGIRILASPAANARKILDQLGIAYQEEEALAVRVTDRPGALGRVMRKLSAAGINVEYAYGSIVKGSDRALIVVGVQDVAKAEKVI